MRPRRRGPGFLCARFALPHMIAAGRGTTSPGRESHSDTALYISLLILHTTHTGWRENDFIAHANQSGTIVSLAGGGYNGPNPGLGGYGASKVRRGPLGTTVAMRLLTRDRPPPPHQGGQYHNPYRSLRELHYEWYGLYT